MLDSANPEQRRGDLPGLERIGSFRSQVADRVRVRVDAIERGETGAPRQMLLIGAVVLTAMINHEYQHDQWIGEVRQRDLGHELPPRPASDLLGELNEYLVVGKPDFL